MIIKVAKLPENYMVTKSEQNHENVFGFSVENLTSFSRKKNNYLKDEKGVLISEVVPYSVAAIAGLKAGMLIKEVNKTAVSSISEFKKAIKNTKKKNVKNKNQTLKIIF